MIDFKILNTGIINKQKPLLRPSFTWTLLLRLKFLQKEAVSYRYHCLYYRIPHKETKGILKVVETLNECDHPMGKESYSQLSEVEDLRLFFYDEKKRLPDGKILKPFFLYMNFKYKKKEKWLDFQFFNINRGMERKRFASSAVKRKYTGVMIWPVMNDSLNWKERKSQIRFLGSFEDDYSKGESIICHRLDDNCNTIGEYLCDRCRYGFFEAVGSKCSHTNTKICGVNRCGRKGWPACPRGSVLYEKDCRNGSKSGFCGPDLQTYCDDKGVLVCL